MRHARHRCCSSRPARPPARARERCARARRRGEWAGVHSGDRRRLHAPMPLVPCASCGHDRSRQRRIEHGARHLLHRRPDILRASAAAQLEQGRLDVQKDIAVPLARSSTSSTPAASKAGKPRAVSASTASSQSLNSCGGVAEADESIEPASPNRPRPLPWASGHLRSSACC